MNRVERQNDPSISPPIDFPIYGMSDSWAGPRWLESIGGDPLSVVRLAHATSDGSGGVVVATLQRERYNHRKHGYDRILPGTNMGPASVAVLDGIDLLINLTWPALSAPKPPGLMQRVIEHAYRTAAELDHWPRVPWRIDDTVQASAAIWHFAGAWVGISTDLVGSYVLAIGIDFHSEGLMLASVIDATAYGFDLRAPLTTAHIGRGRPEGGLPNPNIDRLHPDHIRIA